jgi:hypothetical protein
VLKYKSLVLGVFVGYTIRMSLNQSKFREIVFHFLFARPQTTDEVELLVKSSTTMTPLVRIYQKIFKIGFLLSRKVYFLKELFQLNSHNQLNNIIQ